MKLYPGDNIRFLDEEGEGVVMAVDGYNVMVRTADGFEYPYPAAKLVKVRQAEDDSNNIFSEKTTVDISLGTYGLFLAFQKSLTDLVELVIINRTSYHLIFTLCEEQNGDFVGKTSGQVPSGKYMKLYKRNMKSIEKWPALKFSIMYYKQDSVLPESKVFVHKTVAKNFVNQLQTAPILNQMAYTFQLDNEEWQQQQKELKTKLKTAFAPKQTVSSLKDLKSVQAQEVVDLHSDKLPNLPKNINEIGMLKYQLSYVEKMVETALQSGLHKITFIHGIGDGILKKEVQEFAKKHPHVSSFGKANPQLYGGGATFFKLD